MELDGRQPVELLVAESVEGDLERPLQTAGRNEIGDVARVANPDLRERLAAGGKLALGPGELRAEEVPFAGPAVIAGRRCRGRCAPKAGPCHGGLHGVVFLRRHAELDRPHVRPPKRLLSIVLTSSVVREGGRQPAAGRRDQESEREEAAVRTGRQERIEHHYTSS